jgi:hypothetical protein
MKVARKKRVVAAPKGMVAPKAAAALKGMAAAMSKTISAPLKAATPPKAATPQAAAAKAVSVAMPSTVGGAAGQKGGPRVTKAGVLKIKAKAKRPTSTELSLTQTAKHLKAAKASSSVPASVKRVVAHSSLAHGSDDDRVEIC